MLDLSVDVAGVAGLVLSLWLALSNWWRSRESFRVRVVDYADFGGTVRFLLYVENLSRSPLVVLNVVYLGTTCELEPRKIRGTPPSWDSAVSPRFPVHISPRDAGLFYTEFAARPCTPLEVGTTATLQIQTIRRTVPRTVVLGPKAGYLNKRSRLQ